MTKEKTAPAVSTAKLQIAFDAAQYKKIAEAATEDNDRMGLIKRNEKIHQYQMIPVLINQGLAHRRGEIYIPEDKKKLFMRDVRFSELLAKAQVAVEAFIEYQNKLLAQ